MYKKKEINIDAINELVSKYPVLKEFLERLQNEPTFVFEVQKFFLEYKQKNP